MIRAAGKVMLVCLLLLAAGAGRAAALSLHRIGTFDNPIFVTSDPGDAERLFVVERDGVALLLEDGETKPFADIRSLVSTGGERGLLSIAPAPDFDLSGRFYLDYTGVEEPGEIHVAEMVATGGGAPTSSLRDVIPPIPHPEDANHYGGQLQIGPEGALFVSTGDGGGAYDEHHNAQDPASELGKILRVLPTPGAPTTPEAWSLGLRNPFRFSFDRLTGAMLIGDVGQSEREEVDYAPPPGLGQGANYGWNCMEGSLPASSWPLDPQCAEHGEADFTPPIFEYPHEAAAAGGAFGCAIIGGYVARGPGLGDLYGRYLYGDLCQGELRSFSPTATTPAATDRSEGLVVANLNSFGEDSCGRLYAVSGDGPVYRVEGAEGADCANPPPPLQPSYVGIRAASRKVKRHRRALINAWVAPCRESRRGEPVTLWRGRRELGTRHLDRVCSARFRPRVDRRSTFRVTVRADSAYGEATSRRLTIRPVRHHRR